MVQKLYKCGRCGLERPLRLPGNRGTEWEAESKAYRCVLCPKCKVRENTLERLRRQVERKGRKLKRVCGLCKEPGHFSRTCLSPKGVAWREKQRQRGHDLKRQGASAGGAKTKDPFLRALRLGLI